MKTEKIVAALEGKILTLGDANEQFRLSDYLRKTYRVGKELFDNSTDANAFANVNGGTVEVVEVNDRPKSAFWTLWKQFKREMQAQGVFVTKREGEFVVTDSKPSRGQVVRSKGYGQGADYQPYEFDKHAMIDRDAERYGW
jgi:hypothetical protein